MGSVVLRKIDKNYDQSLVCNNINLTIDDGQFFTFLGPSGCGKTTLLRLIAGFIEPDNGTIFLGNKDITSLKPERRNVGMVFQNYALFPFMTVSENVEYGLKVQKQPGATIKEKTDRYLSMVGLGGLENRSVSELSGGEQQRVALARSLAIEPKVLLLDEPLSNLDARLRDSMRSELKRLQGRLGITTIFVTHDQTEALTMSDKLAVFKDGQCIQSGTPTEIYEHPKDSFVAQFVGETNLLPITVDSEQQSSLMTKLSLETGVNSSGGYFSIRPQHIKLDLEPSDQSFNFPGRVEDIKYNGPTTEVFVRVESHLLRSMNLNVGSGVLVPTVGQKVFVNFSTNDLHFFKN